MAWVKVDDHIDEHPKIQRAGPLGLALYVAGLCYCNRNLTDGFIPRAKALSLLSWEFYGPVERTGHHEGQYKVHTVAIVSGFGGDDVTSEQVIDRLVGAGLWDEVEDGYLIHDYLEHQSSRDEILEARLHNAKRQSVYRDRKRNAVTTHVSNAVSNGLVTSGRSKKEEVVGAPQSSIVLPSDDPLRTTSVVRAGRTARQFQKPSASELTAYCRERRNRVDPQRFLDHYESNGWKVGRNPMKDWKAAVRTWERTDLNGDGPAQEVHRVQADYSALEKARADRLAWELEQESEAK
jgi:hypothetical protein